MVITPCLQGKNHYCKLNSQGYLHDGCYFEQLVVVQSDGYLTGLSSFYSYHRFDDGILRPRNLSLLHFANLHLVALE